MKKPGQICLLIILLLIWNPVMSASQENNSQDITILIDWRGEYPVAEYSRFPEGQRRLPIGYLDNELQFSRVWKAFKPSEKVPEVNFSKNLVLFVRNAVYFNRIGIARVLLKDSVAEVLAMETRTAFPIEDKVGMALAVIPRTGIKYIRAGEELIPVITNGASLAADPLNASYMIDGRQVTLQDGRAGEIIAADSAIKIRTFVIGTPVDGDLDSDGDLDAVLLFRHDPGGSGTFYYVAAALNQEGLYCGTNGVLLGDRVKLKSIAVKENFITATYYDRGLVEPMSAEPSLEKKIVLTIEKGKLSGSRPIETGEQVMEGWVTIGHEVRSFKPCSMRGDYWLSGDSTALEEISAQYRKVLPGAKPYMPLYMILAGKFVATPLDGFGMDYKGAFEANHILGVRQRANCPNDSIAVDSPFPGEGITSPLVVRGRARGTWFFEGDFPVILKDINGRIIASGFAAAKSEWMTGDFVEFEGILEFEKPDLIDSAILVFKKDNPSNQRELDDEIEFFVSFK